MTVVLFQLQTKLFMTYVGKGHDVLVMFTAAYIEE